MSAPFFRLQFGVHTIETGVLIFKAQLTVPKSLMGSVRLYQHWAVWARAWRHVWVDLP